MTSGLSLISPPENYSRGARSLIRAIWRDRSGRLGLAGLVFFCALAVAGQLMTAGGIRVGTTSSDIFDPPSLAHLLGTDELGRDVLTELAAGTLVSLAVGVGAALISAALGFLIGVLSGYVRGWVETLLMGLTDVM